jgi:hypothetical protein
MAGSDGRYEEGLAVRREVLGADYCGVPAALESFRVAERVLDELDVEGGQLVCRTMGYAPGCHVSATGASGRTDLGR